MKKVFRNSVTKQISSVLAVFIVVLSFSACGSKSNDSDASSIASTSTASSTASSTESEQNSSVVLPEDRIEAATGYFKIGDGLPTVLCVAVTDKDLTQVYSVEISDRETGKHIQTIEIPENNVYARYKMYSLDVDFSGRESLLVPCANNYGVKFYAYRWDDSQSKFVKIDGFESINTPIFNSEEKRIYSYSDGGGITGYSVYTYEGNNLIGRSICWWKNLEDSGDPVVEFTEYLNHEKVKEFTLPCDKDGNFDRNDARFKKYLTDPDWDLDSDKWEAPSILSLLEIR
ncbi:MAG: hypothetical protein E7525_02035 [Ruminococcaceae bacterium]|nr:hypothetical protein [Oscillospiraceae bacterium]